MKNFPERLKITRGDATMAEFAKKIGVSFKTYQHYEYGTRDPSLEFIEKLSSVSGVSADWLLGLSDTRKPGAAPVVTVTGGLTGGLVASGTGNATVHAPPSAPASPSETSRLLGIIESQQRVIETLSRAVEK